MEILARPALGDASTDLLVQIRLRLLLSLRMANQFTSGDVELVGVPEVVETDDMGGTAVMSVRLPRNVIAQLKVLAEQEDTGATVVARDLII